MPKPSVLFNGLPIVTQLTQRLPVATIPEQRPVPFMWLYMVNHSGWRQSALLLALNTEGVLPKVYNPGPLPAPTIAPLCRCPTLPVVPLGLLLLVLIAVPCPGLNQGWAAGGGAWFLRARWH